MSRRLRTVTEGRPAETAPVAGLAATLWLPGRTGAGAAPEPEAGVVVLHGAGSVKESHHDFARAAAAAGCAVIVPDLRGHGDTGGRLDGGVIDDVAALAGRLRERTGREDLPVLLRGSSMGGWLALVAAAAPGVGAGAVVAICPASSEGLLRALRGGRLGFAADVDALAAVVDSHDLETTVAGLTVPVLLLHAEGDETVPVAGTRELARHLRHPESRLITVPGGHHRSVQHDAELQAVSLRFARRALGLPAAGARATAGDR